jgi:hypothetical protein
LNAARAGDREYVDASLAASDAVQQEDIALCEDVQQGLQSRAYDTGRYIRGLLALEHLNPPPTPPTHTHTQTLDAEQ